MHNFLEGMDLGDTGGRIKEIRKELGLSQKAFSERLGVSLRAYQTYERGQSEAPIALVRAAFQVFRVNPTWLVAGDESWEKFIPEDEDRYKAEQGLDIILSDLGDEDAAERRVQRTKGFLYRANQAKMQAAGDVLPIPRYIPGFPPNVWTYEPVDEKQGVGFTCSAFSSAMLRCMGAPDIAELVYIILSDRSMEPTIGDRDWVLVDRSKLDIKQSGIFALEISEDIFVRRIQIRTDGGLLLKSDSPDYENEIVPSGKVSDLNIIGRVVWYGRKA